MSDEHQSFGDAFKWGLNAVLTGVATLLGIGAALALAGSVIALAILLISWVREGLIAGGGGGAQLPSLLLTAASLFVLIFSVLVGLAAVFGWRSLRDLTAQRAIDRVEEELDLMRQEHQMSTGHTRMKVFNRFAYEKLPPDSDAEDPIRVNDHDFLDDSIDTAEKVLSVTPNDHERRGDFENNLAFLLSIRGEAKDADRAARLSSDLRSSFPSWDDPDVLNTYARVVGIYADAFENPREELAKAEKGVRWIFEQDDLSEEHKENARRHLQVVRRAVQQLSRDESSED